MTSLLEDLMARVPKALRAFSPMVTSQELPDHWNRGPEFASLQIRCLCGETALHLKSLQSTRRQGFLKRQVVVEHAPPFFLYCASCQRTALLFDPQIHGWDGQAPDATATPVLETSLTLSERPGEVFVNYSYQSLSNYEELVDEGVTNPEDYFDTFTVYFKPQGGSAIEIIGSFETA